MTNVQAVSRIAAPLQHGGDLAAARRLFPGAPEPLIDLSTGINPHSYPIPPLDPATFTRLPDPAALERLAEVVAAGYGAPSRHHVVPAPGTQALLAPATALARPGHAAVLSPTYAEFAPAAARAGHRVSEVRELARLAEADVAVLANPNNPDGRFIERAELLDLAGALRRRGGLLIVDEAFMDAVSKPAGLADDIECGNIVVLRSFGKFFGLAGLRLGFALTTPPLAARLAAALGPWPVSGPAITIGTAALADHYWIGATQERLGTQARRLDALLCGTGLHVLGGTPLFRLVHNRSGLFDHLGRAGIWVRRFPEQPEWLRFGLPANEAGWKRLAAALAAFPPAIKAS